MSLFILQKKQVFSGWLIDSLSWKFVHMVRNRSGSHRYRCAFCYFYMIACIIFVIGRFVFLYAINWSSCRTLKYTQTQL